MLIFLCFIQLFLRFATLSAEHKFAPSDPSHHFAVLNKTLSGVGVACAHYTEYFVTPNIKFPMCTGQNPQDLKNGMSIINLIQSRGFLPTCRVMHLMLWMLSEVTPHHALSRDHLFVDVGANIGSCSVHIAALGLPVISVEPVIQHVATIQGSVDINPAFRIDLQHIGMASGPRLIRANFGHGARNWGATEFHEVGHNDTAETELRLKSLDQVVGPRRVSLLKVDCEGCEWNALKGGARTLKKTQMIKIELVQNSYEGANSTDIMAPVDILKYLVDSGFALFTDTWAENELYFGNKGKQVLDIDRIFGSAKFNLPSSLEVLIESAKKILQNPIDVATFNHRAWLKTATDVIAIEAGVASRMKARWLA